MAQVTDGAADPLAKRVRYMLDERNIMDVELAKFIGISGSGLSKSLRRPGAIAAHIEKVAEFFGLKEKDLVDTKIPDDELMKRVKTRTALGARDEIRLPASVVVRLAKDDIGRFGRGRWAVLAEKVRSPQRGELVAHQTAEGWQIRRFVPDTTGAGVSYLIHPHDDMAILHVTAAEVKNLRVVLFIGDHVDAKEA